MKMPPMLEQLVAGAIGIASLPVLMIGVVGAGGGFLLWLAALFVVAVFGNELYRNASVGEYLLPYVLLFGVPALGVAVSRFIVARLRFGEGGVSRDMVFVVLSGWSFMLAAAVVFGVAGDAP